LIEQILEYERRSYMQSLLVRLDKMTMAASLEARTPFLDYRFVNWSKGLPARYKIGAGLETKRILKERAATFFSRELVYRRKVGFGVPLTHWFREQAQFKDILMDIGSGNSLCTALFPAAAIKRMVDEHIARKSDHTEVLWALTNLHLWNRCMGAASGELLRETSATPVTA
jgi:asparagine synthase (glutamine-hydrolysing)